MGKISEAIEVTKPARVGMACSTGRLLDEVDAEDRADLVRLLASSSPSSYVARVLDRAGHVTGASNLQRHRIGDCKCPKLVDPPVDSGSEL
jgi:hypothetical protein